MIGSDGGTGPSLTMILAADLNGVIGVDGGLPWHLPGDLARFKAHTMGKPMIMGRKTFASFKRPLPGRIHIVVTSRPADLAPHSQVRVAVDVEEAQVLALGAAAEANVDEVMVIGGARLYEAFLSLVDTILLSIVHGRHRGDTHCPPLGSDWRIAAATDFNDDAVPVTEYRLRRDGEGPLFQWPSLNGSTGVAPAHRT